MADYKAIHGKNVLHLASDLDSAEAEGEIWFNTASTDYKTLVKVAGAWASGGNMNSARYGLTGSGTQTAGLAIGGATPAKSLTELYNGATWTETGDLNTAREALAGEGTSTATLVHGGNPATGASESFNGTSWTEVAD